jgi:hypothetical protein
MPKHWIRIAGLGSFPPSQVKAQVVDCAAEHGAFLSRIDYEATGDRAVVVVAGSDTRLAGVKACLDDFDPVVIRSELLPGEEEEFIQD